MSTLRSPRLRRNNDSSDVSKAPRLEARGLCAGYGSVVVVRDLDLEVRAGEVVALLGANGAGKTTTLLTLAGVLQPHDGNVLVLGASARSPLHQRARSGLALVTEDRAVLMRMTVLDNLRLGRCDVDLALDIFPELKTRLRLTAGLLSGGEQQMLALGRMLARRPEVLLADELSLGLAPLVVERLLGVVRAAADEGVAVLLVEQHVRKVLRVADRAYVLQRGRLALEGTSDEITAQLADVENSYLSSARVSSSDGYADQ